MCFIDIYEFMPLWVNLKNEMFNPTNTKCIFKKICSELNLNSHLTNNANIFTAKN